MEKQSHYTLSYRAEETCQVMAWLAAGQCGTVVGLRGAGKSNFVCFLIREDVRQHYLGPASSDYVFVHLDMLKLEEYASWAVYDLILDGMLRAPGSELDARSAREIVDLHDHSLQSRDALAARRVIERVLEAQCQRSERRFVLVLDEFDSVFATCEPALLRYLRALRDQFKERLMFLMVVPKEPDHLRDDLAAVEHFCRLVGRNTCHLGPYADPDARQMLHYLAARRSVALSEQDTSRLVELSGGHAGLLKAATGLLWGTVYAGNLARLEGTLNDEPAVQHECRKVWDSLTADEKAALCSLVNAEPANPNVLCRLEARGVLRKSNAGGVFSPLFAGFVRQQAPPPTKGTLIHRSPRLVQLDGKRIDTLTGLEFEMLCYLYEQRGHVCTKDDLIAHVYRQRYGEMQGGVADESIQALVSRLREKIEPDRARPRYIVTVRGEGYRFVGSEAQQDG